MPDWQPKEDAPDTFSVGEAFLALVTGDPDWAWLGAWIPFMGKQEFITEQFCLAGPPVVDELTLFDFMTGNRSPLAQLLDNALLANKLRDTAQGRIFSVYCELPNPTGTSWRRVYTDAISTSQTPFSTVVAIGSGAVKIRATHTQLGSGGTGAIDMACYIGGTFQYYVQDWQSRNPITAIGQERTFVIPAGITHYYLGCQSVNGHWDIDEGLDGSFDPWEATPAVQPTGVIQPTTRTYTDIADLGLELDQQEFKLDLLISQLRTLAISLVVPPLPAPISEVLEDGVAFPITQGGGIVVTLSNIPAGVSEDFGNPVRLHGAGRLTFQTASGYMASIEIEHSPFVVQPLPPGVTAVIVHVIPPIVAELGVLPQLV